MERRLALWWVAANTAGWCCAIGLLDLSAVAVAAVVGVAQWLPLRRHVSWVWIPVTAAAWYVGIWMGIRHGGLWLPPDPIWAGAVGGSIAAAGQGYLLWRRGGRPWLWGSLTLVAWLLGWVAGTIAGFQTYDHLYSEMQAAYLAGGAVGGLVIGAVTAPALRAVARIAPEGTAS